MIIGPIEITIDAGIAVFWRGNTPCANIRAYLDKTYSLYEHDADRLTACLTLRAAIAGAVATTMTRYGLPDCPVDEVMATLADARAVMPEIEKAISV